MARNRETNIGESSRKDGGSKRASKTRKGESSKPRSRKRKHRSEHRGEDGGDVDDDEIDIVPRRMKPSKKGRYGRCGNYVHC